MYHGTPEERFWKLVQICIHGRECTNCHWLWLGQTNRPNGHGHFYWYYDKERKKSIYIGAHVFMWYLQHGTLPAPNIQIRHTDDIPSCVQPYHLLAGTSHDNHVDMMQRGRSSIRIGERNPMVKIQEDDVRYIFYLHQQGLSSIEITQYVPLSRQQITNITHGRSWKYIYQEIMQA